MKRSSKKDNEMRGSSGGGSAGGFESGRGTGG
jgi:hypothetical protein